MRNKLQMRLDGASLNRPNDRIRGLKPSAVREVNGYRVCDVANAAVLVFKRPVVPVARGLQRERHHHQRQQCGQNSARDVPPVQQYSKTPKPMILRRSKSGNSRLEFTLVSLNSLAHTCRTSPSRATIL